MLEVRKMPALVYVAVRHVGPYNQVGPSFDRIVGWAREEGLMTPETKVIGVSWDNPITVPAEKLRYDAAVTITRRIDVPDDMVIAGLPAMEWAMTTHEGSFAGMTDTFMALGRELGTRKDLVGTFHCGLEIYGPMTGNEADLRTELGLPVVRIS